LPFTQQGSSPDTSAHHSRTFSLFSSLLPQQHLSPINETDLTNASLSSERVPREIGYDGCSDDSINGHVSALHALSPGVRRVDHVPLQPVSPVQGEVAAALDAHNRDSVIQNMDELIADAAPMQVSEEFLLLLWAPSFFFFVMRASAIPFPQEIQWPYRRERVRWRCGVGCETLFHLRACRRNSRTHSKECRQR
jgi:hypothetical protein